MFISGVAAPHAATHEPTGTDVLNKAGASVDNPNPRSHTDVGGSYNKQKETELVCIPANTTLTIKCESRRSAGAASSYWKVYRNGSAVGAARMNNTSSYVNYSEDITGWSSGDLLQIYCAHSSGSGATTSWVQNLEAVFKTSQGIAPVNQDP